VLSPAARAEALSLGYGQRVALRPSTFEVPAGAVTAVIGPNGSGKSTLLNALAGVIAPRSGSLEVLGGRGPRGVAYVMQTVQLPEGTPITVREVVAMARYSTLGWWRPAGREDRRRVTEAMDRLEVADLAGRHLSELSGGQRQRVYVAQGIAQEHELLLLDEPLTGLDLVSARTIDRIVHAERGQGQSVVLTTHDLDEARAADHVVLVSGEVVASGPPERVLTRPNLELAYGLGSLHEAADQVIDDPGHTAVPLAGRSDDG
jgi:ABC-type Mn2+/Zn2+ transport system ATPase subunit